jgi:geranylgeranyl reductase family protein
MIETNVCIIGAGPGGAAAALRLAHLGIPSVLIDKAIFPRDKICGDGLTGRTVAILNRIDPAIINELEKQPYHIDSWGVNFSLDVKRDVPVAFKKDYDKASQRAPCFVVKRLDFDNHLINKVKEQSLIQLIEGVGIENHEYTEGVGWTVSDKKGNFQVRCKILLVANGPLSPFVRHVANIAVEPKHYAGAVRAYYKNVSGCHRDNFIELHFLKDFLPGYFWIFPLPNGDANVGVGMLTSYISERKVNLKKALLDIVENRVGIKERFAHAQLDGDIVGFPLPLGSKRQKLSGDHYMLIGDAAHLVDPLTGEGIGNAVFSGYIAADQVEKCLKEDKYSAAFLKDYDTRIWRVMGPELNLSYRIQRLGRYPAIFNFVLWAASKNVQLSELVYSMFNNIDMRKKVLNPVFWFKMLVNAK